LGTHRKEYNVMARKKRKIKFKMEEYPEREFYIGEIYRFNWDDVYKALQIVHDEFPEVMSKSS